MTWQPKSSLTVELHTGLQATWNSVPLHPSSRLWDLDFKWNAKFTLSEKRTLDHSEQTVQFFFSTAQGKILLTLSLVQKWLGSPFPEDVWAWWLWCTDSSFSPLLVKLSQVFESALLDCILKLAVIPVACAPFSYPKFFLPVNFALICFDTALCKQPPLSVMTFCDLPSLWRAQCSSSGSLPSLQSSPLLWFQRTRDTWNLYCMDGHYWNSNVNFLIFWDTDFWLSWAVSSNHQKRLQKLLKCFTLHVMNLKYMKVSLFEISYKKKWTFSQHSNLLRCTCITKPLWIETLLSLKGN